MNYINNSPVPDNNKDKQSLSEFVYELERLYTISYLGINASGQPILNNASYPSQRRFQSLNDYVNALFSVYSRYIVLRVDLKYSREFSPVTTLQEAQADLSHFFANMRHNHLFKDLKGYIWKLEEGEKNEGYHFHLIFFYINEHTRNDSYYVEKIGKYWQSVITHGRGSYFSPHRAKYKAQLETRLHTSFLGLVNYYDEKKRYGLLNYLAYICKDEQALTNKPSRTRIIGHGKFPDLSEISPGRPRKYSELEL